MKKVFSMTFVLVLLAAFSLPNHAIAAPRAKTSLSNMEFNAVATVAYSDWLTGSNSTLDIHVSNLPDETDFSNGVYTGWCIQPRITGLLHGEPATIYSSLNKNLPSDLAALSWDKVNYVLNHKIRGAGKTDLEFFKDVQTAIWLLVGDNNPEFGISPEAQQMVDDANAHPGYKPENGDIVAFIVYSDGTSRKRTDFVQEVVIEVKVQLPPTETPTPTLTSPTPTETMTMTPSPTETITITPSPTETGTMTPSPTETETGTPTLTITPTVTPTITPTITTTPVCEPQVVMADFRGVGVGQSVEGMGVVVPGLNIDAKGTAVRVASGTDPGMYNSPNTSPYVVNGGIGLEGGFGDLPTKNAAQAHLYTFTFAPGASVSNFSLRMLDYGDWNPTQSVRHYVSMTAYNAGGVMVAKQELSYNSEASAGPTSSDYGNLSITGDASALPGQPGNWTWNVSGAGIVRVVLEFGEGFDPNIAFDTLTFITECR